MDFKLETERTYNRYAGGFEEKFRKQFEKNVIGEAEIFIKNLNGKDIIDIGSGPGNHADFFSKRGLNVLCVDISKSMVELCRKKGLMQYAQILNI